MPVLDFSLWYLRYPQILWNEHPGEHLDGILPGN